VEKETGILSLKQQLDREEVDTHTLVVYVTHSVNGLASPPADESKLTITIDVNIFLCCFFDFGTTAPQWDRAYSFSRFLDHTQLRTTFGRSPLDE
jgi:hypothetical protein